MHLLVVIDVAVMSRYVHRNLDIIIFTNTLSHDSGKHASLGPIHTNAFSFENVTLHTKTRLIKHGNLGETGFQKGFQRVSNSRNRVCKGPPNGL